MPANPFERRLPRMNHRLCSAARALEIASPAASLSEDEAAGGRELEPLLNLLLQRVVRLYVALDETASFEEGELLLQRSLLSDVSLVARAFRSRVATVKNRLDAAGQELAEVRLHLTENSDPDRTPIL